MKERKNLLDTLKKTGLYGEGNTPTPIEEVVENNEESDNISNDITTSHSDITTSQDDSSDTVNKNSIDMNTLTEIIEVISSLNTNMFTTPVRLSNDEREYMEDFVIDLRKHKLKGKDVSISKIMRYATWYLLTNHKDEFISSLKKALLKDRKLPIK